MCLLLINVIAVKVYLCFMCTNSKLVYQKTMIGYCRISYLCRQTST